MLAYSDGIRVNANIVVLLVPAKLLRHSLYASYKSMMQPKWRWTDLCLLQLY